MVLAAAAEAVSAGEAVGVAYSTVRLTGRVAVSDSGEDSVSVRVAFRVGLRKSYKACTKQAGHLEGTPRGWHVYGTCTISAQKACQACKSAKIMRNACRTQHMHDTTQYNTARHDTKPQDTTRHMQPQRKGIHPACTKSQPPNTPTPPLAVQCSACQNYKN